MIRIATHIVCYLARLENCPKLGEILLHFLALNSLFHATISLEKHLLLRRLAYEKIPWVVFL